MMSWAIVSDSSNNLRDFAPTATDTVYAFAPLKVHVGTREINDTADLDIADYFEAIDDATEPCSTACPSVGEWKELFELADNIIAIPISSNLSGSLEAAETAKHIVCESSQKNIHIVDSHAAGGKLELLVVLIDRYLTNNPDATFEEVSSYASSLERNSQVLYSLSDYTNLTRAGRMPKVAGVVANKLNIRMLGTATAEGTMKIVGPARGEKKMAKKILSTMESDGFTGGEVYIDHVKNEAGAQLLADAITEKWPASTCHILPCRALCSFYAENSGIILGYGWDDASGLEA